MKLSVIQRSAFGLGLALLPTMFGGFYSYRLTRQLLESAHWVEHTGEVLQSLEKVDSSLRALESSARGYALTGSDLYLESQETQRRNSFAAMATLRSLTIDNRIQQQQLGNLDRHVANKMAFIQKVVDARGTQNLEAARKLLATGQGIFEMDAVDDILRQMRDREHVLMHQRLQDRVAAAQAIVWWIVAGTIVTIILVTAAGYRLIREVRERQRTSLALRRQTSILESILRCMSDGVVVADADTRFTQFNPAAERILGVGKTEVSAVGWSNTYHLFRSDQVTPYSAEDLPLVCAIRGQNVDNAELFVRHPDRPAGTWISVNARPLLDDEGNRIGGIAVFRDTTEQKRAESAIRQYAATLEHANQELDSKAQALSKANQELEQFAYIASHDLQEPLRMVTSFCQLLKKRYHGQFDEKADQWLDFATDGAGRMHILIQDLLQYSRLGKSDRPAENVDLNALFDEVRSDLALAIHDAGADVQCDPLPTIWGNRTQLHQLFQNLIANALKFHGSEPPVVRVACRPDGDFWECAVRDNGIGIEPKYFERIFKIFQRLHTKQDYPGTGIGLAVCAKIVERHGGRIWVESELGRGSTFHFTLQVADAVPSAVHEQELQSI
jgi:PAS domain S-box-containing protein